MFKMLRLVFAMMLFGAPVSAIAEPEVAPSERVVRWVNVREMPDSSSLAIAHLKPGDRMELIETIPAWHRVRLQDGREGYVARAWTTLADSGVEFRPSFFVHMIDVGTGLAIFVEGPGFTLLYDAGSNDDLGRGPNNRVLAYLRKVRPELRRLDHVILSHPHRDHVELMPDVLAAYEIGDLWDSGRTNPICAYRALLQEAAARHIPYHDAEDVAGDHVASFPNQTCYGKHLDAAEIRLPHASPIIRGAPIQLGREASLRFLHATAQPEPSFNENSLVVSIDLGRSKLLLMGDGEAGGRTTPSYLPKPASVEGELLACCTNDLKADILVVGHHGSKTSSRTATLDKIQASDFLISAGPTKYATVTLPDREVVEELASRGAVFRTDLGDAACRTAPAKIGPDNDNQPGGCDNVLIEVDPRGIVRARVYKIFD